MDGNGAEHWPPGSSIADPGAPVQHASGRAQRACTARSKHESELAEAEDLAEEQGSHQLDDIA